MEKPEKPQQKGLLGGALTYTTAAILATVFIVGIGLGMFFGSYTPSSNLSSVATRVDIEQASPNPEICLQYGASAVTVDLRAFMTLNPFSVFVTQPRMVPGCVMRSSNWNILQSRNLINGEQMAECRRRMNTFAYTGDIDKADGSARIDCVYQNDAAGNLFRQAGSSTSPENDRL
ncbi:DUF3172 domain-containing protein [Cyanobacteria bacterium FACHB-502]|jgi:hypothetical protein|nr:DUF3172 domain-containing protein [Cyanobacteria bacterium FACHB-502]MBD2026246.1 DUF3172 domain-containing protein [Leptolyngbya sp. FACHB-711]